jgi:hypothetical protein
VIGAERVIGGVAQLAAEPSFRSGLRPDAATTLARRLRARSSARAKLRRVFRFVSATPSLISACAGRSCSECAVQRRRALTRRRAARFWPYPPEQLVSGHAEVIAVARRGLAGSADD